MFVGLWVSACVHNHTRVCVTVCAAAACLHSVRWWSGFRSQGCEVVWWKLTHGGSETGPISCRDRSVQTAGRQSFSVCRRYLTVTRQLVTTLAALSWKWASSLMSGCCHDQKDVPHKNKTSFTLYFHAHCPQNITAMSYITAFTWYEFSFWNRSIYVLQYIFGHNFEPIIIQENLDFSWFLIIFSISIIILKVGVRQWNNTALP